MKKLLFHVCCAPCFVAPYYSLKDNYHITGFWYNPNIHLSKEYENRRDCLITFTEKENVDLLQIDEYGLIDFINKTIMDYENRCNFCYLSRLEKTAIRAKSEDYDYFSTSLLYSKRQKHDLIKEIGVKITKKHNIPFLYNDFRTEWNKGIELSKTNNFYRQSYCGCLFSDFEKFIKKNKKSKHE